MFCFLFMYSFSDSCFPSVQLLSHVWYFATSWTTALQASLSTTNSWSLNKLMSIVSVTPHNRLILCRPLLLLPPIAPSIRVFPKESHFLASGGQSTGVSVSTSVLPKNTQDWSHLGWTAWISLQSKGFSRVYSNTTFQKHQLFGTQLSLYSNSPYITTGKTTALTRRTFAHKVMFLLFNMLFRLVIISFQGVSVF